MALADKKVLLVIPPEDFQDEEYDILTRILESRGIKISIASTRLGEVRGIKGMGVKPNILLDDVKYYDYDAIIFIGGEGARQYFEHEKALKLAKDADYKILGAISTAPLILANAGVLKEKRATAHRSLAGFMRAKNVIYTGQPIEVDGKIVTAEDHSYMEHFGNALIKNLEK